MGTILVFCTMPFWDEDVSWNEEGDASEIESRRTGVSVRTEGVACGRAPGRMEGEGGECRWDDDREGVEMGIAGAGGRVCAAGG